MVMDMGDTVLIAIAVVAIILILVFLGMVVFCITTYNGLIRCRNKVRNSFSQLDAQLQRRFDMIPNLVETVKGFSDYEKEIMEHVTASRNGYVNASSKEEKVAMNAQLTSSLRNLFVITENYPELKSNVNFLKLQEELAETEDKITFSRQFYNDAVTIYNNKIQMFPGNLLANAFGFTEEALFDAEDEVNEAPKVQF